MAGLVSLPLRGLCIALLALVALGGCQGTQHQLFDDLVPPVVDRPIELRDAGTPPPEQAGAGGIGPVIDPALDAGPIRDADPGLDPSIKFPWSETLPGKGTCRTGLYIGRFSCLGDDDAPPLEQIVPRTGQIVFTLEGSEEEQILLITGGDLTDDLFPVFLWGATISGSLDCLNEQRLDAVVRGTMSPVLHEYETVLTGWLNSDTLVIRGGFNVSNESETDPPPPPPIRWMCTFEANAAP